MSRSLAERFESLYRAFSRPTYIDPDPLLIARRYEDPADREIAGLIASALALGRVRSICAAAAAVLAMVPSPHHDLIDSSEAELRDRVGDWYYRFFTADHLFGLLLAIKRTLETEGSLQALLAAGATGADQTATLEGLHTLVQSLRARADGRLDHTLFLADPYSGSSCKRHMLFLRWMVRHDAVDPGGWDLLRPSQLIVPVDVHMLRVAHRYRLTSRSSASLATALEITRSFAAIRPDDPVRYDFCLTRPGINPDLDWSHPSVRSAEEGDDFTDDPDSRIAEISIH